MPIYNDILLGKGWQRPDADVNAWEKPDPRGRLLLRMELESVDFGKPGGPLHFGFALLRADGREWVQILDAQWVDWDHSGRLVYSQGGKLSAVIAGSDSLDGAEVADFGGDQPARVMGP